MSGNEIVVSLEGGRGAGEWVGDGKLNFPQKLFVPKKTRLEDVCCCILHENGKDELCISMKKPTAVSIPITSLDKPKTALPDDKTIDEDKRWYTEVAAEHETLNDIVEEMIEEGVHPHTQHLHPREKQQNAK